MREFIKKHKTKFIILVCILFSGIIGASAATILASSEVSYSNTKSGMEATNVQDAIDELYGVARLSERMDELEETLNDKIDDYWKTVYPVGSIYISIKNTNPGTTFGGTWVAYGSGRTLVGVNTSDTNFNTVEKTGGATTHSIAVGNLPVHNHSIPALSGSTTAANNVGSTTTDGNHNHSFGIYSIDYSKNTSSSHSTYWTNQRSTTASNTSDAGNHSHKLNIPSLTVTTKASNTNGCTNCSGTALNTQDPYITVYMWKRTA